MEVQSSGGETETMLEKIKGALKRLKDWYKDRENWVEVDYPDYRRPWGWHKRDKD